MTGVKVFTREEVLKELNKVGFIILDGYYLNSFNPEYESLEDLPSDVGELRGHTDFTYLLYHYGFQRCGAIDDDETYDGVAISKVVVENATDGDIKWEITSQLDSGVSYVLEVGAFVEFANAMVRESALIEENERLINALREIDTHTRSTKLPTPYITETLKKVLPEYQ